MSLKVVKREICAVVTKGTLTEGEMLTIKPDASYMISVTEGFIAYENQKDLLVIGVCIVDVSTSRFMLGQVRQNVFLSDQYLHRHHQVNDSCASGLNILFVLFYFCFSSSLMIQNVIHWVPYCLS